MTEWIDWSEKKPEKDGYYLFAVHSCLSSYGNSTDINVYYYSEDFGEEYGDEKTGEFFKIIAWMVLPKFPSEMIKKNM